MSSGWGFFVSTLGIYLFAYGCMGLGFNIQLGMTGLVNLSLIVSVAAGAYVSAVLELGPPQANVGEGTYAFGTRLPFPIPTLAGAAAGAVVAVCIALLLLRVVQADYFAIASLVIADVTVTVVGNVNGLFNGQAGLYNVPSPMFNTLIRSVSEAWALTGIAGIALLLAWAVSRRVESAPVGRVLRAVRENAVTAGSIGVNVAAVRVAALAMGGFLAGLGGALLVYATGSWSTASWQPIEVLVLLTAVVLGGRGSVRGTLLGIVLVPFLLGQGIQYIPVIGGDPALTGNLEFVLVGLIQVAVLWWRPGGLLPERPGVGLAGGPRRAALQSARSAVDAVEQGGAS